MTAALPLLAAVLVAAPLDPPTADRDIDKRARELAQQLADQGADADMRREAAEELSRFKGMARPAIPTLVRALRDPDAGVRSEVAYALGRVSKGDRRAISGLVGALGDPAREVWHEATLSLAKIDPTGPRTAAALGALLLDRQPDEYLRRAMIQHAKLLLTLVLAGDLDAAEAVEAYLEVLRGLRSSVRARRKDAASKLAKLGPAGRPALPALRLAAEDGDPLVRRAAVEALKKVEGQGTRR